MPTATTDLVLDSLRRRLRALHSLYADALATMDLGHVNHVERAGVLPIAFSLFHYTNMQDVGFAVLSGQPVLWDAAWQDRVRMAIDDHGKERTVDEMIHQRIAPRRGSPSSTRPSSPGSSSPGRCRRRWRTPSARGSPARTASPSSTPWSAGSISTASVTWVRSSWPAASSASAA